MKSPDHLETRFVCWHPIDYVTVDYKDIMVVRPLELVTLIGRDEIWLLLGVADSV